MTAFTLTEDISIIYNIKGDFRSGVDFVNFIDNFNEALEEGLTVQFDLSEVIFMDSDTMRFIGELEAKGTVVTWGDRTRHVFKRYQEYCDVKEIFDKRVNVMKVLAESGD